jgi:hypothetical protein
VLWQHVFQAVVCVLSAVQRARSTALKNYRSVVAALASLNEVRAF